LGFSVYCFSFSFSFLLHYCEVTLKTNYLIHTNICFICNRLQISYTEEVSVILETIYYFLSFGWISTCLPKVILNWPICTYNKIQHISKNYS
jgi:hypothetical protein